MGAGLLRVAIMNLMPATLDKLHRNLAADDDTIDAMVAELVEQGRIELTEMLGREVYARAEH